jgi:glycosyltransferase involved in cell wall biosynthesis
MLNILINAYACSPNWGSEQGMGWNWIVNLAQYCNLYIITEGEYKDLIDEALRELPQKENIHFYYNPVSDNIRKMCWNQGDWRFYYYYRKWQKSTYGIALQIIKLYRIDVIHQLNMIGFREPGFLWKIKDIPFVWGPIGGMEHFPMAYLEHATIKQKTVHFIKNIINPVQTRYAYRVRKAMKRADMLIASVKGVQDIIERYYGKQIVLINETGCYPSQTTQEERRNKDSFDILWVGKFDFRKQLGLALQTIAKIKFLKGLRFHIIGTGSDVETLNYKRMAEELCISDICDWHGLVPNVETLKFMRRSDLFFFTSVMEATSTVVLEAIGSNLPIVCFNTCGFGSIVKDSVGLTVEISNPLKSVIDFAEAITTLYSDRNLLQKYSNACAGRQQELSWGNKARKMVDIYEAIKKNT